jgi:leader peptidase (prepilin peptidase) / N-methyltransferase
MDRLVILVPTLLQAAFFFALGACVGSFVNVIAWRWPRGQDIVNPPSRCGTCGRSLQWWENVPVFSWIALRGRCRTCGVRIGAVHVVIEIGAGALFAATVVLLFAGPFTMRSSPDASWWIRLGGWGAAPALFAVLWLWSSLLAASLIDAETGYIPLGITSLAIAVGLVSMTAQALIPLAVNEHLIGGWPSGLPSAMWCGIGLGGLAGTALAALLLWRGWLPRSFATIDPLEDVPASVARFEMLREIGFLLFPVAGCAIGGLVVHDVALPAPLLALGSSALGLLVGAGAIWLTRILGTLGFGREAMGLGDVHLMAAAGAVIGWRDGLLAYLLAPFMAILWVLLSGGLARMRGKAARELPYGPHLALACVIVFLGRPWVGPLARTLFGF